MSTTNITNEVVRMSFEGGDFERKISKSLSALQKLKEHLSFKKVSEETGDQMSAMAKALDTMAHKAESVWDRVTSDIRDKIKDRILGVLHEVQDMTVNQLAKGWDKYAEKTSAVATLVGQGYNMDEVNEQMKLLNRYTDETSYQFNEMVNSIGKFTASGQSLEDANIAMQGIANWAALSGANATKASQAMYQLSQAMGKGALKLDDYKSIQNFGMDTQEFRQHALDAAVTLGTLRKNAEGTYTVINDEGKAIDKMTFSLTNFTQNLSDGMWLTSDVMMKVFSEYGSALDNINAKIESGLADTASEAIEQLEANNGAIKTEFGALVKDLGWSEDQIQEELKKWSNIRGVTAEAIANYRKFNEGATEEEAKTVLTKEYTKVLQDYANQFGVTVEEARKQISRWNEYTDEFGLKAYKAAQEARTFRDAIDSVKDAASTQWMNVWEHIFGDYGTAKGVWTGFANYLYDLLVDWLNDINDALDDWVDRGGRNILLAAFSDLGDAIKDVRELISEVTTILFGEFSGKGFLNAVRSFKGFTARFKEFVAAIKNAGIIQNVAYALSAVGNTFKSVLETFYYAYRTVFPKTAASVNPIIVGLTSISKFIRNVAEGLNSIVKGNLKKIQTFFEGVLNLLSGLKEIARTVLRAFGVDLTPEVEGAENKIKGFADTVFDFFAKVGEKLTAFSEKLKSSKVLDEIHDKVLKFRAFIIDNVWPLLKKALTLLGNLAKAVGGLFIWAGQQVAKLFKKIPWDKFIEALDKLKAKLTPVGEAFKKFGKKFKDAIAGMIDSMTTFNGSSEQSLFQRILGAISEGLKEFKRRMKGAWDSFKEILGEIGKSKAWIAFSNFVKKVFSTIKMVFTDYVKPVLLAIWDVISGPVKKVLNMLKEGQIKELLDLVKQIFNIGLLHKLMGFFTTFREFFVNAHLADIIKSISSAFHGIANMFNSLADTAAYGKQAIKAWKNEKMANTLLKIIVAIALLIGLVFALSFITPERAKKMGEAFTMVVSAALVIIGLLLTVGHAAKQGKASYFGIAAAFIAIGVAVMLIVKTINEIGEELTTNPGKTIAGIVTVLVMMVAMWGMITLLIKAAKGGRGFLDNRLLGIAAVIAAIGVAIFLISSTFEKIGKLKSEDFWQALAGVILMITALSAATWLLNVQKSQKGTLALIGLILVIRFMLLPMLRSIAKQKFDLGQALLAVFIPLLALTGYMFLMTKMINQKGGMRSAIIALAALAIGIAVISNVLIPAIAKIQLVGNTITAAIGILILMMTMVGVFAIFGKMEWTTIVKGASGLALASLAIGIALLAMGEAMKLGGTSEGFLSMGLGMAVVLIAMAGAMALIGKFASSAIIGASAILILAAAIALLTQSVIAFKRYVLGEDIGSDLEGVTRAMNANGMDTVTHNSIQAASSSRKQEIKDATETIPNGKVVKRKREEAGEDYVEDFTRGMGSTDSKRVQNKASEDLVKNLNKGTNSMSAEQMLKQAGIDTTELYTDGFEDYESIKNLKIGGEDIVDTTTLGIEGIPSIKELQDGADLNIDTYLEQLGLNSDNLMAGGEGVVEDMSNGMSTNTASGYVTDGVSQVENLLNGTTGFGGLDLSGSGANLTSTLMGGMGNESLVGSFVSSAVGKLGEMIRTKIRNWAVENGDSIQYYLSPFLWVHDTLTGEDTLDVGKKEQALNKFKSTLHDWNQGTKIAEAYRNSAGDMYDFVNWWFDEYGYGKQIDYFNSGAWEEFYNSDELKNYADAVFNERLDYFKEDLAKNYAEYKEKIGTKYSNFYKEFSGDFTDSEVSALFDYYLGLESKYIEEKKKETEKAAKFIDEYTGNNIFLNNSKMKEAARKYLESAKEDGENVVKGFTEGTEGFDKIGADNAESYMETITDKDHLDENSPSKWAHKVFLFVMEGAAEGLKEGLSLLDDPLYNMQLKIATSVFSTIVAVQYLLDNAGLEMRITPVVDMDNLQYTIGGVRFDKEGNYLGSSSYAMSQDVSKSSSKGFIGQASDSSAFYKVMSNKLDLLNSNLSKISPNITIENTYGIDTVVKGINKMTKMNGGKSVIK